MWESVSAIVNITDKRLIEVSWIFQDMQHMKQGTVWNILG